jgi:hypothetical protein
MEGRNGREGKNRRNRRIGRKGHAWKEGARTRRIQKKSHWWGGGAVQEGRTEKGNGAINKKGKTKKRRLISGISDVQMYHISRPFLSHLS